MNFQRKKVAIALGMGGFALVAAGSAFAQDIRVNVTGSNIKRVEGESAVPLQVITREQIEATGAQSAMDILNYVSANNSGNAVSLANTIGTQTNSVQTASLRGLGGQNTLVLMNGKRLTQSSGEIQGVYGTNLDAIPFAAIERVEILKDGASAIYGSDAIGGVINFIMRQEYKGIDTSVYYGGPTRGGGGGEIFSAQITGGWGDLTKDRFNIFGSYYYQKQNALDQNKRNFSNSSFNLDQGQVGVSSQTFPGFITTGGIGSLTYPNCSPSIAIPAGLISGADRCWYDPAAADGVQSIPEVTTNSFFGSGRYQINADWQAYATGSWSQVENDFTIQPTPLSNLILYGPNGDIPSTFLLPPSSQYYPTAAAIAAGVNGQPLNIRYRAYGLGLRNNVDENTQWQAVAGIKGSKWNWDFDTSFAYSHSETTQTPKGGFARYSQIVPLLNSGTVNPFGPDTPQVEAQFAALQYTKEAFKGESSGWMLDGKASKDVYKLPAGPLALALGFQVGKQELTQSFDSALQIGDVTGYGGNNLNIDASRDVWAIYGELAIPIVKNLEATLAVRFDDYSDFGNTTNPKVALRWTPIPQVLLRSSWGTGFVAPSLTQAYGANTSGLTQVIGPNADPLRCPTTGDAQDCQNQFSVQFGGNRNLKPQTSTNWGVGMVLEPVPGYSLSVDYFNIKISELFSNGVTPITILNDQALFGNLVTRGPVQPQFPTIPGPIISIDQRFINLGETEIQGIDADLRLVLPPTNYGKFVVNVGGSYYIQYDQQQPDGSFAGFVSNQLGAALTGVTPRYKQYATLTWTYGPWLSTLGNLYQSSYIDVNTDGNDEPRRVSSMSIWDLYGSYTGFKNWKLALGVKNLLDTNPPYSNQNTSFQQGYDPTYYDARARFVYGTVAYTFK